MKTLVWRLVLRSITYLVAIGSVLGHAKEAYVRSAEFFASTNLLTFRVEIGDKEWERLTHWPKTYVAGRVRVGEHVFERVGVRLKGGGTFEPIGKHPSLALKFNWQIPDQTFAGLTKLYLNNSGQDATYLCELIASSAFADANLAAPRITQARVELNGRELGLCVVAEPVNKLFLKQHFGDSRGYLYEGEFRDIRVPLEQDNGPPSDQSDLRQLFAAASKANPALRRRALGQLLDVEWFLDFVAVEMIVANWDGYAFHQNNYRIYHQPAGCMVLIPHGLDNTIFESGLSIMPPRTSVLVAALVQTEEEQAAFRERVALLVPKVLDPPKIAARVQTAVERMTQGAGPNQEAGIRKRAALFQQRVVERADHLQAELGGIRPRTPEFDTQGLAQLEGWVAKCDWNQSPLEQVTVDQRCLMTVQATNGFCFGSWRLAAWLPPGAYRLEGAARTSHVAGLPSGTGSGAGVRVLGNSRGSGLQGSVEWTPISHQFVVEPGREWVELVAELRAYRGSVRFDPHAFRLMRISTE